MYREGEIGEELKRIEAKEAGIGVGGQGASDLGSMEEENIAALCDVDWAQAAGTFRRHPDVG